jgi:hypothetical protein
VDFFMYWNASNLLGLKALEIVPLSS